MIQLRTIQLYDTTLRDGEQTPYVVFSGENKLKLARQLEKLGIDILEVGFPAASEQECEAVQKISAELKTSRIAVLARAVDKDLEVSAKALREAKKSRLSIVVPISDRHLSQSLRWERKQAEEKIQASVAKAKSLVADVEFIATDATRTEYTDLLSALQTAASAGASTLVVADTVGIGLPDKIRELFKQLRTDLLKDFPKILLGFHGHNDFGLAAANSVAAAEGGADQIEGTVNGLGERAGNAALEEIAMIIQYHSAELGLKTNLRSEEILVTSEMVKQLSGVDIQPNKALVGQNAFLHAAGMHQQAMLKDPLTFEPFDPKIVGSTATLDDRIIFGKFVGRNALRHMLDADGIALTEDKINTLAQKVKEAILKRERVSRNRLKEFIRDL